MAVLWRTLLLSKISNVNLEISVRSDHRKWAWNYSFYLTYSPDFCDNELCYDPAGKTEKFLSLFQNQGMKIN